MINLTMPPTRAAITLYTILFLALLAALNLCGNRGERRLEIGIRAQRILYLKDRRKHIARDCKLAYVHVPKTGGTTIEDSSLFDDKRRLGISPRSHFSVRALKNASETDGFVVATHIRDPCERFVSAFIYMRYDDRSKGVRQHARNFGLFESETIEELVDWLDKTDSWNSLKSDIFHFKPMVFWMVDADTESFGVDVVMCQEEWEEGVTRLVEKLQVKPIPRNILAHKRVNKAHTKTCKDLEPRYYEKIMDEYALDACLFGYGSFGLGNFSIVDRNETNCIGAQFDRSWFSERLAFCKVALGTNITSTDLVG